MDTDVPAREREVEIVNRLGLHARSAARFVTLARDYDAEVELVHGDKSVDGTSILGLLMPGASRGTRLRIVTRGAQAGDALDALCALVDSGFGEEDG